jgi:hypothetical protein
MSASYEALRRCLDDLCRTLTNQEWIPLLEADVAGYLFAGCLRYGIPLHDVHLDTRVCGVSERRYDLVVGPVDTAPEDSKRACIRTPELVVQIKFFPQYGFTWQQHNVHFHHVLDDDLPSLAQMSSVPGVKCLELLVDLFESKTGLSYLQGTHGERQRTQVIAEQAQPHGIEVLWVHRDESGHVRIEPLT